MNIFTSVCRYSMWSCLKMRFIYITLQATYAASLALCITDMASVQPRLLPKSTHKDFGVHPYIALVFNNNNNNNNNTKFIKRHNAIRQLLRRWQNSE